ncbi:hypothetical protein L484_008987 [Morus notabilis]|uniref:Uncharacterized protein n=1 Tax=Morus notabilis TaxID=981085 RepID=W9R0U0_9ROSA|nr:hypothetical protein L484_008987 [Morus notabilis]
MVGLLVKGCSFPSQSLECFFLSDLLAVEKPPTPTKFAGGHRRITVPTFSPVSKVDGEDQSNYMSAHGWTPVPKRLPYYDRFGGKLNLICTRPYSPEGNAVSGIRTLDPGCKRERDDDSWCKNKFMPSC